MNRKTLENIREARRQSRSSPKPQPGSNRQPQPGSNSGLPPGRAGGVPPQSPGLSLSGLQSFINRNKGNEAVSGAVNDLFYNSYSAALQTESDAHYARTMMPLELERQRGLQGIATEADMRRISAEGAVLSDLTAQQGRIQTGLAQINSRDVRHVANKSLAGDRYTADAGVKSTRIGADATRDVARTNLEGTRYTADAGVRSTQIGADAQRYGYDQELAGVRDTNRSQEEQRRIQGDQDRKTLTQGTDETLRLRADARGAIAAKGRRFFG